MLHRKTKRRLITGDQHIIGFHPRQTVRKTLRKQSAALIIIHTFRIHKLVIEFYVAVNSFLDALNLELYGIPRIGIGAEKQHPSVVDLRCV